MNGFQIPNSCTWLCDICGQPVGANDMVGFFHKGNGEPIRGTLGFWHNNFSCGDPKLRGQDSYPCDLPIYEYVKMIPQEIYTWLKRNLNGEEVGIMLMRTVIPGYDQVYREYGHALAKGIIEPNLPPPALWPHEIAAIQQWQQQGRP